MAVLSDPRGQGRGIEVSAEVLVVSRGTRYPYGGMTSIEGTRSGSCLHREGVGKVDQTERRKIHFCVFHALPRET